MKSFVDFYLSDDAYECYHCPFSGETEAEMYDAAVQLSLMHLMGVPVTGKVNWKRPGFDNNCYWVTWSAAGLKYEGYFELFEMKLIPLFKKACID